MIRADQIPDDVVEAAWNAFQTPDEFAMKRAIAAALNAWPMSHLHGYSHGKISGIDIVLPLEQEDSND